MNINKRDIKVFKIRNRKGYAAICLGHLTEGVSGALAVDRMIKALKRSKIIVK
jgi:peptide deformylase